MSGFSARWLALREPYDRRARNPQLLDAVVAHFRNRSSIAIVDIGFGTGATLRALTERLQRRQHWRLVDNNLGLLTQASTLARPPDLVVAVYAIDLVRDLELALDGPTDLVTTSALLDLVSEDWLERLTVETAARRLPVYAALTYQGSATFDPGEPFDLEIIAAVNRHQRRDKGFGPALGPEAPLRTVHSFERVGYDVRSGASDWVLGPQDRDLQLEVLAGWAGAASELGELPRGAIQAWLARRRALVAEGRAGMRVGHVDVFAVPVAGR
jgi:hypothetical protein